MSGYSLRRRPRARLAVFSLIGLVVAAALYLVVVSPGESDLDLTAPPAEDGQVTYAQGDAGTSVKAPLTLPPAGKTWGVNHSLCYFTNHYASTIRADKTMNRGISCETEKSRLQGIGASAIRLPISWYNLEYDRDVWDERAWSYLTKTIDDIGLPILAMLGCTPYWATSVEASRRPGQSTCTHSPWDTPEIDAEAQEFAQEVVRRLGNRVIAVEVYNEPNFNRFWRPTPDPVRYGKLFTAMSRGAHTADPGMTVLFGGGALNRGRDDSQGLTIESFFKRAIAKGGARPRSMDSEAGWDAVSAHVYPPQYSYKVEAPADGVASYVAGTVKEVRRGIRWTGDVTSKIWWTEFGVTNSGYQTATSDPKQKVGPGNDWADPDHPPLAPCGTSSAGACNSGAQRAISEDASAVALESSLRYLFSVTDTGAIFLYELFERGSGNVSKGTAEGMNEISSDARFGLLRTPGGDGTTEPKPAYCKLQALAAQPLDSAC
jgi:hypothetical protein